MSDILTRIENYSNSVCSAINCVECKAFSFCSESATFFVLKRGKVKNGKYLAPMMIAISDYLKALPQVTHEVWKKVIINVEK